MNNKIKQPFITFHDEKVDKTMEGTDGDNICIWVEKKIKSVWTW